MPVFCSFTFNFVELPLDFFVVLMRYCSLCVRLRRQSTQVPCVVLQSCVEQLALLRFFVQLGDGALHVCNQLLVVFGQIQKGLVQIDLFDQFLNEVRILLRHQVSTS